MLLGVHLRRSVPPTGWFTVALQGLLCFPGIHVKLVLAALARQGFPTRGTAAFP